MKVQDLLDYFEGCDPEMEVRVAMQPNYPQYGDLLNITVASVEEDCLDSDSPDCKCDDIRYVFLCAGYATEYAEEDWWHTP